MKTEVISREQQYSLLQFIIQSMAFLQMLNCSYRHLVVGRCLYEKDRNFYFSFHKFQDSQTLSEISLSKTDAEKLRNRFSSMEEIELPLNNVDHIESFYNTEYRKFVAFVARLLNLTDAEFETARVKLLIIKDRSPLFNLKLDVKLNA